MSSKETILKALLQHQPELSPLPDISHFHGDHEHVVQSFTDVFTSIGGTVHLAADMDSIKTIIDQEFDTAKRIVTNIPFFKDHFELINTALDPHDYENIELAILPAHFGVAENGALWFTDDLMGQRIIPYISQHLVAIIKAKDILPTLHEAYERIGIGEYSFGGFIAGPSKTADIEQALVLGAHGPLSMKVFILD